MVKIISALYAVPIDGKRDEGNIINELVQEREVEKFLDQFEHRKFEVEWKQSSCTDGKNVFTVITAFIKSI